MLWERFKSALEKETWKIKILTLWPNISNTEITHFVFTTKHRFKHISRSDFALSTFLNWKVPVWHLNKNFWLEFSLQKLLFKGGMYLGGSRAKKEVFRNFNFETLTHKKMTGYFFFLAAEWYISQNKTLSNGIQPWTTINSRFNMFIYSSLLRMEFSMARTENSERKAWLASFHTRVRGSPLNHKWYIHDLSKYLKPWP